MARRIPANLAADSCWHPSYTQRQPTPSDAVGRVPGSDSANPGFGAAISPCYGENHIDADTEECVGNTLCLPHEYVASAPTATTDRVCQACGSAQAPNADQTACETCPPGTHSRGGAGYAICIPCEEPGLGANEARDDCVRCPSNYYSPGGRGEGECKFCSPGSEIAKTYRDDLNIEVNVACTLCGPGNFSAASADGCAPCDVGQEPVNTLDIFVNPNTFSPAYEQAYTSSASQSQRPSFGGPVYEQADIAQMYAVADENDAVYEEPAAISISLNANQLMQLSDSLTEDQLRQISRASSRASARLSASMGRPPSRRSSVV